MEPYKENHLVAMIYLIPVNGISNKLKIRKGDNVTQNSDWLECA